MAAYLLRIQREDAAWEDNMAVFNTNPGDKVIVTVNGETLTCKVLKVVGQGTHGTFSASIVEPIVPKNQLGDMHIKSTVNKDEILRNIEEIQKKELASVTRDDVLEKFRELFPPIGVKTDKDSPEDGGFYMFADKVEQLLQHDATKPINLPHSLCAQCSLNGMDDDLFVGKEVWAIFGGKRARCVVLEVEEVEYVANP